MAAAAAVIWIRTLKRLARGPKLKRAGRSSVSDHLNPAHLLKHGEGVPGEKIHHRVIDGIVVGPLLEEADGFPDPIGKACGPAHILHIDAHLVEKEGVEAVELLDLPEALGKIGSQGRPEFGFVQAVDEGELP